MKYQISGFLTGTQILASLSPPGFNFAYSEGAGYVLARFQSYFIKQESEDADSSTTWLG